MSNKWQKHFDDILVKLLREVHDYIFVEPISFDILRRDGFNIKDNVLYGTKINSSGSIDGKNVLEHLTVFEDTIVKELYGRYNMLLLRGSDEDILLSYNTSKRKLTGACSNFKKEIINKK